MNTKDLIPEADTITVRDIKALLRAHPEAIYHMHEPSPDLITYAAKNSVYPEDVLHKFRKKLGEDGWIYLVKENPSVISEIPNPSEKLQLLAVAGDPGVIKYIKKPTLKVQMAVLDSDPKSLIHLAKIDPAVIKLAVDRGLSKYLPHVIELTDAKTQLDAVKARPMSAYHIKNMKPMALKWLFNSDQVDVVVGVISNVPVETIEASKTEIIKFILRCIKNSSDIGHAYEYPHMKGFLYSSKQSLIKWLLARGIKWPELDVIAKSLKAMKPRELGENSMKYENLINEDLGNLAQLKVGSLINVLKQPAHMSRRYGSNIGDVGKRFYGYDIGSTSEIIDVGQIKKGMTSLRKAFKDNPNAGAFALYIGGHAVVFGTADSHSLAGSSRENKIAYDLTKYADIIERLYSAGPNDRQYRRLPTTTITTKQPPSYATDQRPRYYTGDIIETGRLSGLMDLIQSISNELKQPVTAKLVMSDDAAMQKRRQRQMTKDAILKGTKDLKIRLAIYKNTKRPTADNIEAFVRMSLNKQASVVQFANGTYRLAASAHNQLNVRDLLSGKPFDSEYQSVDPGSYDSINITYMFDPSNNQLMPIFAKWIDRGKDRTLYNKIEVVINERGYLKSQLGSSVLEKNIIIPKILTLYKAGQINKVDLLVSALEKLGLDWREIGIIRQSIDAAKQEKN